LIEGNPTEAEIVEAWSNIYAEWLDINENNEGIYLLQLQKEILLLSTYLIEVESCVYILGMVYHHDLVAMLRDHGFDQTLDTENNEEYYANLKMISDSLAFSRMNLEIKEKEFNDYMSAKKQDTINPEYFDIWLVRISKFLQGGLIRANTITVKEFVIIMKEFLNQMKSKKKNLEDVNEG